MDACARALNVTVAPSPLIVEPKLEITTCLHFAYELVQLVVSLVSCGCHGIWISIFPLGKAHEVTQLLLNRAG